MGGTQAHHPVTTLAPCLWSYSRWLQPAAAAVVDTGQCSCHSDEMFQFVAIVGPRVKCFRFVAVVGPRTKCFSFIAVVVPRVKRFHFVAQDFFWSLFSVQSVVEIVGRTAVLVRQSRNEVWPRSHHRKHATVSGRCRLLDG